MSKKLLQINSVLNIGSTGKIVENIANLAIQNGWESYIAYGRKGNDSNSNTIKIGNYINIIFHVILTRLFDLHGLASKKATIELIKKIDLISPNIIHLHNIHGYYLNFPILFQYLKKTEIPVIWTLHDCWPITGHCAYFSQINCIKWKSHCHKCPLIGSYPKSFYYDRSENNFSMKKQLFSITNNLSIITVSNWLNSVVIQSFLSKYKISTINNGVDLSLFRPNDDDSIVRKEYGIDLRFALLGVASEWSERKGLKDFIRLSYYLPTDIVIILVGITKELRKIIPKNIICIPQIKDVNKLSGLYSACDVVLNLSCEETFGLTTIEGLACGTPSIVYNTTASPELIDNGTGIVVQKGDINGLLNAITILKNNGKSFYKNSCISRAKNLYNKDDRYLEYIALYEEKITSINKKTL